MKALFLKWQQAYDQLSQRERLLVALSASVIICWLSWLPVESSRHRLSGLRQQLEKVNTQINAAQTLSDSYRQALNRDPNQSLQRQIEQLNRRQNGLEAQLQAKVADMLPAERMPILLERMLQKTRGNKLLALESIAPAALLQTEVEDAPNLYRHGIRLKLSAGYFDFLKFVKAVDAMPEKLRWQRLNYQVTSFPQAEIELELYSLSMSEEFMRVAQN